MEAEKPEKTKNGCQKSDVKTKKDLKLIKSKNYSEENVREAVNKILNEKWTVYKASKTYKVPWSTLKGRLAGIDREKPLDDKVIPTVKVGRPFNLSEKEEIKVILYIQKLQSMGFDISCNEVRKYAYSLSTIKDKNVFSEKTSIAGWSWWVSFKNRYKQILNLQDYFSVIRDTNNTKTNLLDFYSLLKKQLEIIGGSPENLWNFGESSFSLSASGDQKNNRVHLFTTINASGETGPSQLIFMGKKPKISPLENYVPPNFTIEELRDSSEKFSDKFFQFLQHFILPKRDPIIILMDSQNHQISPQILELIEKNKIILLPFPAKTNALMNPLNIIILKPLKQILRKKCYEKIQNGDPIKKLEFLKIFTPFFNKIATPENILAGFKDAGIFPFNPKVKIDYINSLEPLSKIGAPLNLKKLVCCNICGEDGVYNETEHPRWIECTGCKNMYHFICVDVIEYFPNFLCQECTSFSDDDFE